MYHRKNLASGWRSKTRTPEALLGLQRSEAPVVGRCQVLVWNSVIESILSGGATFCVQLPAFFSLIISRALGPRRLRALVIR